MDTRTLLLPRSRPWLALRPAAAPAPNSLRLGPAAKVCPFPRQRARLSSSPPVSAVAGAPRTESSDGEEKEKEEFDWLDQWYPFAPLCDLDPGAPQGKTVLVLRVVAWYDRNAGEWRVFEDACPHRAAPLSEGRIDGKGRLQCVYHGWCFDGRGSCEFIPQAPALAAPAVHKNTKACASAYPAVVQNDVLWFYPRAGAEHQDVLRRGKRPPLVPEIDDPSFTTAFGVRDLPYGYDVLMENLMDPAHGPYSHKGLMQNFRYEEDPGRTEFDLEGGVPLKMKVDVANIGGYASRQDNGGYIRYTAPCTVSYSAPLPGVVVVEEEKKKKKQVMMLVFFCIPVAPGRSRIIWAFPRNFAHWLDIIPRWFYHIGQNTFFDSDMYLLHVEEYNYARAGVENWHKAVYAPTSSDTMVLAFRNWFRKYCNNRVGWAAPVADRLPATATKDKVMERYWSHVAQCTSCSAALKAMNTLEVTLQVASVGLIGFLAVSKVVVSTSIVHRSAVVAFAMLLLAASRCLATFVHNNFYFQDYVHAYK